MPLERLMHSSSRRQANSQSVFVQSHGMPGHAPGEALTRCEGHAERGGTPRGRWGTSSPSWWQAFPQGDMQGGQRESGTSHDTAHVPCGLLWAPADSLSTAPRRLPPACTSAAWLQSQVFGFYACVPRLDNTQMSAEAPAPAESPRQMPEFQQHNSAPPRKMVFG